MSDKDQTIPEAAPGLEPTMIAALEEIIADQGKQIEELRELINAQAVTSLSIGPKVEKSTVIQVGKELFKLTRPRFSIMDTKGGLQQIDLSGADEKALKEAFKAYPNSFSKLSN